MSSKKLLVADDSPTIQKVIRLALSGEGYDIQSVSSGPEAMEKIPLFRPDVVLIDVSLPDKNAFDVKQELEQQGGWVPQFVLMSRAFEKVDDARAESGNFAGRLIIPFDPAQLRSLLNSTVASSASGSPPSRPVPNAALPEDSELNEIAKLYPPAHPKISDEKSEVTIEVVNLDSDADVDIEHSAIPSSQQNPNQHEISVSSEESGSLLEEEIISSSDDSPSYLAPTLAPSREDEDDIQQLTRQTMELSGLDNEWSIEETGARREATLTDQLPPTPHIMSDDTLTSLYRNEPSLQPYSNQLDSGESTFDLNALSQKSRKASLEEDHPPLLPEDIEEKTMDLMSPTQLLEISQVKNQQKSAGPPPAPGSGKKQDSEQAHVVPLSQDQMQRLMRAQLKETLEEMAREMLPDLAERIIKQEIHKMLSDNSHPAD